jgi:hypothetical protein
MTISSGIASRFGIPCIKLHPAIGLLETDCTGGCGCGGGGRGVVGVVTTVDDSVLTVSVGGAAGGTSSSSSTTASAIMIFRGWTLIFVRSD